MDAYEVVTETDALGRELAVKRVTTDAAGAREALVREARLQGRVNHPAVPSVIALRDDALVTRRLAGTTLREVIRAGSASLRGTLRAFVDVCRAVELAHTKTVVHGQVSASRIVVGEHGEVWLVDWSAARDDGDPRTDVTGLGGVLFELLAGQPLYKRGEDGAAALPGDQRPSRRAPDREVPPELDELCANALAGRVATARQVADGVMRFLDGVHDDHLRKRLAADHLARAQKAFVAQDPDVHATAFREAAKALAYDPHLDGAPELMARVMLEPPKTTPKALADALAADRLATVRRMSRAATWAYVAYLVFAPAFLWLGAGQGEGALIMTAVVSVNAALLARQGFTKAAPNAPLVALGNAVLIGLIARLWSPFLAAPGLATITTMSSAMSPIYRRWWHLVPMAALMILAVLLPWILEVAGALDSTAKSIPGGFELTPPGLHLRSTGQYITAIMYIVAIVSAAAGLGYAFRGGERPMRERLLRVAWQLRQLVPTTQTER